MEFGQLTTYKQMENYYQKMRAVSRTDLIASIYKNNGKVQEHKIQADLTQAFVAITSNYNYDTRSHVVNQILYLFDIKPAQLDNKTAEQREKYLQSKILDSIQQKFKNTHSNDECVEYQVKNNNPENSQFDWVGVKSNFPNLRSIFQQILLEKVRQFDDELTRITDKHSFNQSLKQQVATTARTIQFGSKSLCKTSRGMSSTTYSVKKLHKQIQTKGFTNVLIRDHSEFTLKKWTRKQQKQFQDKKNQFKVNFKKNNQQTPIIFQFVKKYTNTVKARDNIFQKWEHREKNGISPEQLKYLCSTSLFLNKTLNISQKQRLNKNIKSLGKQLISKLQFNIAEKIIQTYKQFMKKVADLRAHYYQQLTEKRKHQYQNHKKNQIKQQNKAIKRNQFLKFKQIFEKICNSEKMKIVLNPKIYRWIKFFIDNLKKKYEERTGKNLHKFEPKPVFNRLVLNRTATNKLIKTKLKYPSARVIKREDIGTMRQPMKKYIPSQRFYYQRSFQDRIKSLNSVRVKSEKSFRKQITGGPKSKPPDQITVSLTKKQIILSSANCLKYIIKLQAKWRAIRARKQYQYMLEDYNELMKKDFEERLKSLKHIYPIGQKINIKAIKDRLKRVSMRTLNILKPYTRVARKPINNYTSFSKTQFSLSQLKIKQGKNSSRRLGQFGKMVEQNQFNKLLRSGFVVTAKQINDSIFKDGASAMWWAVKNSNYDLTKIFLEGGGNPNAKNFQNNTCLHEAMQNGDIQIIFLLLDYGADLNLKNSKKVTPLYYATPKMQKWLGLQEAVTSYEESLKDNNSLFYKTNMRQDFYPDHYY